MAPQPRGESGSVRPHLQAAFRLFRGPGPPQPRIYPSPPISPVPTPPLNAWFTNREIFNLREDRRHDGIIPRNPIAVLTLEDGSKMTCRIIDMSLSGAAIAAENRPALKSLVSLGKVQARVVRNLEEGFALEFVHQQNSDTLEDSVTAR